MPGTDIILYIPKASSLALYSGVIITLSGATLTFLSAKSVKNSSVALISFKTLIAFV